MEENYINYYKLLFAILNSDEESENGCEYPIVAYDENDDLPVGVFKNAKTCGTFFRTTSNNIHSIVSKKLHIKKIYRLERVI